MIRIDAKKVGIKTPIRVNETIKKVKETFKYQSTVLSKGKPKGKSAIDRAVNYYDNQAASINDMVNYIVDMLGLSDKQLEKVEAAPFPEVVKLSNQLVTKILHYDEGDNDPKKGKK